MRLPVTRRRSSISETRSFCIESQRKKLTPFLEAIPAPCFQLMCRCAAVVHDSSANDGVLNLCVTNSLRTYFRQISIDDDDVRELAGSERALFHFVESGVSRADSVGSQSLVEADLLLGDPTARMLLVEGSPRHRGVDSLESSRRRYRPVAAEREKGVSVLERAECVGGLHSLLANDLLGPAAVIDRMIRLHAGNDA